TLVTRIGDEDLAGLVDRDRPWSPEGALLRIDATLRIAEPTPLADECAIRVEVLHAVIPGIGHIHVPVWRDRDAPRLLELAVGITGASPRRVVRAIRVEHRDARRATLADVQTALRADRHVLRIHEGGP